MVVRCTGLHGDIRSPELVSSRHLSKSAQGSGPRYLASHTSEDVQLNPFAASFSASIVWEDPGRGNSDDERIVERGECR
jgi:hypothetical protein